MKLTDEMIEKFVEIYAERGVAEPDGKPGQVELGWTVRFRTDAKEYEAWVAISDVSVVRVAERFELFKWLWPLFNTPFVLGHNLFLAYRGIVAPLIFEALKEKGELSRENLVVEELLPDEELQPQKRKEIDDEIIHGVLNGKIKPVAEDLKDLRERAVSLLSDALGEDFEQLPSEPDEIRRVGIALIRRMFSYMPEENLVKLMTDLELYEPDEDSDSSHTDAR